MTTLDDAKDGVSNAIMYWSDAYNMGEYDTTQTDVYHFEMMEKGLSLVGKPVLMVNSSTVYRYGRIKLMFIWNDETETAVKCFQNEAEVAIEWWTNKLNSEVAK